MADLWPARRIVEPALVAVALAVAYLLLAPLTADLAAQEFRAELFEREGLAPWNNLWFGGHHVPGYGILSPALGALIGPRLVGALSAVAAALLFAAIADRRWGERARVGILWFAAATSISLFTGRTTFALGVVVALGAALASQRGHRPPAIVLAALCPLASPIAALFLALGGAAYWLAERRPQGLELGIAALGVAVLMALLFPEGGTEPFVGSSFWPALAISVGAYFVLPAEERLLRIGVALYVLALVAAFAIDNPLGGNVTRMGTLLLGPLLACALWPRRWLLLALTAPVLLAWQIAPVVRDLERAEAEPSVTESFYEPLRDYLARATGGPPARVEVVPTENHWEAAYLPPQVAIARGWERQLDRKLNPIFYEGPIAADAYRDWLDERAVGYVALPDAPLDYAGEEEAALIERGPEYLRPVWGDDDWRVYRVRDPMPLASPPAELTRLDADSFVVSSPRAGTTEIRVRHTPYWSVTEGGACVAESDSGFTLVDFREPGEVQVEASFAPWRALDDGETCGDT